jgi:PST family polysaccharide transporter
MVLNVPAYRLFGFRWQSLSLKLIASHGGFALGLLALALVWPLAGGIAAVILFLVTGFAGGHVVLTKIGPSRSTAPLVRLYTALGWSVGRQS